MSKIGLISIIFIPKAFIAAGYYGYTKLIEAGYPSCVLSIEEVIQQKMDRGDLKGINVTDQWQILGEDEEQALFAEFRSKGLKFDCKQFVRFADGTALVGSKGHVRFRKEGRLIRVRIESEEGYERPY